MKVLKQGEVHISMNAFRATKFTFSGEKGETGLYTSGQAYVEQQLRQALARCPFRIIWEEDKG